MTTTNILVFVCFIGLAGVADASSPSDFVGSNVCKTCHPNITQPFFRNPHAKLLSSGNEKPERFGCEACHGPGKAHVEARGGKATIFAFSVATPEKILDKCLSCHSKEMGRANIRRSPHTENDVVCSSCHSIHKSATPKFLLAKRQVDLCSGCHANVKAQFALPYKHRVNEGFMNCTDCHNPHGTFAPTWRMANRPRMVEQALANDETCLKCHTDKRGPFLFEHAAVRVDGCEVCHQPHGSTNARLLRRPVVFTICLECHNGATGFGRTGQGVPLQSPSHNMNDPRFQQCTSCHVKIHGSNADATFLR